MPGPPPAVAAVRVAVRRMLADLGHPPTRGDLPQTRSGAAPLVLVACSGGADSLALAAGVAFQAPRLAVRAGAVVVDHGLQPGSDAVAATAARQCRGLGLDPVVVVPVSVSEGAGPEDAARRARYAAFEEAASALGAVAVLLGHTRDDQAEQVLLGLTRGSGTRSMSGMPPRRGIFLRPLLEVTRAQTEATCAAYALTVWRDPHNTDERFARVRARRALADLDAALGPGIDAALARTAALARADADALDLLAERRLQGVDPSAMPVDLLDAEASAVRRRMWRLAAAHCGSRALTHTHLAALDALVADWRGQGPVDLPGEVTAHRAGGTVHFRRRPRRRQVPRGPEGDVPDDPGGDAGHLR